MKRFRDLSGKEVNRRSQSSLDKRLNSILNAFGEYANIQAAKDEKLILNVVDSLARNASGFTNQDQFDLAFQTLNEAKDSTSGGVADSLLSNYEATLMKQNNTFTADSAIKDAYIQTKEKLSKLTGEDHTTTTAGIIKILDEISENYRADASAQALKMLDSLNQDVRDAIDLSHLLDNSDKNPLDNTWDVMELGIGYNQVKELMLSGEYSKARTKANSIQLKDSDNLMDEIGTFYHDSVKHLRAHAGKLKNVDGVDLQYGGAKVINYIPQTAVGAQKMYPQKLNDLITETGNVFKRYFSNADIDWGDSDKGQDLKDAFDGKGKYANTMGGWHEFMDQLNAHIIHDHGSISNEREIDPQMYEEWLNENVDFMPNKRLRNDPGGVFSGGKGDDNKLATRIFVEYMLQYNGLLQGNERLAEITRYQSFNF